MKSYKLWSWLALLASVLCIIAALYPFIAVRMGTMEFRDATGLARTIIQASLLGVLPFTLIVLFFVRKNALALLRSSIAVLIIGAPLLFAVSVAPKGTTLFAPAGGPPPAGTRAPPLNDISTSTIDPPIYSAVISIRPEGSNTLEYPTNGPELQAQLFPDIAPIQTELKPAAAFEQAVHVADSLGWNIVYQNTENGMIEAIASTVFFGLKDDVVIRIRATDSNSSIVDIRSHSRIGRGDQGKNAERVRLFIAEY
jgi:uncharacterized protein (DUF1499 family)